MPDVLGIFVGGRGERLGGRAKGLLRVPGGTESIVERLSAVGERAGLEVVLVGTHEAYAGARWRAVADDPAGIGPLGGLAALLRFAGNSKAFVLSSDLPHVDDVTFTALVSAPDAVAVAPRLDGRWEPFFARYDAARALPFVEAVVREGRRSLQAALDACGAVALQPPVDAAALRDWDTPRDVVRDGGVLD